jgi:CelD/BcsL family acetyltransferase involved in cellulose biosynthesis
VTGPDLAVVVSEVTDFATLEARWRDLETRSDPSFFQSWTWTGCLVEERFPDPVLVEARESGRTVALALFNRRGGTLYLGESGDPTLDCPYIEFNGVLAETGREVELTLACLRAARIGPGRWGIDRPRLGRWSIGLWGIGRPRLVLGGIDASTEAAAALTGQLRRIRSLAAPVVDLADQKKCFLDRRSANTRQQLRRSNRAYAQAGPITIERAESLTRADAFLEGLIALHQAAWTARGQPGAFAAPFFSRFHRALITRGLERGEIALLRVAAGDQTIGFLYNFMYRGRCLAYQSGFDYADAGPRQKPGLTCHHEAIRFAHGAGARRYDFLAGDDRYKRSLSDRAEILHWVEVVDQYSPRFVVWWLWDRVTSGGRLLARGRDGGAGRSPLSSRVSPMLTDLKLFLRREVW